MKGDTDDEKVLTEARAMVVRDYLVRNFKMDDTKVKTIGLGKSPEAAGAGVAVSGSIRREPRLPVNSGQSAAVPRE